ncbi:Predicted protein [Taphrina deformans PYCC 5710]|uniref:PAS domain-containing protein n=1 Tax=Taphrina deformans (strain PYCC 5710 / ATCC 11124 / CBS 356.35 / IMI 108563 / JCM 9778 / NBRC 8474) TaxID=1097556 RepID=R4X794_TAPDE|nr:Predicted protein [Taphrina deformans PYCC 5710]|eukprot:CCG80938.1 Predicted protein [Taphrina deformans PYCC 5710]
MHDLSADCIILYASDSIVDVLGYQPHEVSNKSTFDFFHMDDLPFARDRYENEVALNYASSLAYVRVRNKEGEWIGCECVFSCVYDVLIAATTVYKPGPRSNGRALAAPIVQSAFMASREAARYEMLAQLSAKFSSIAPNKSREPRAALILNRFTKQLTILHATHALTDITGMNVSDAIGCSFFDIMDIDCVEGAIDAIDRAKENDSVAYMRFRWESPQLRHQQAAAGTMISESNGQQQIGTSDGRSPEDLGVEAVVSCTSDGIIVVLRSASTSRLNLPPGGSFVVPWSTVPLYTPPTQTTVASDDSSSSSHMAMDPDILTSIQEISVFVWGLQHNKDVVQQHAQGTPGTFAIPNSANLTESSAESIEPSATLDDMSTSTAPEWGTSAPNAIEIESD